MREPTPDARVDAQRRRAVLGIRASLLLNAAALPLSFVTNLVLGRVSPEALGTYGAIQVLVGTSFTFLVFGGANVFTRFVPALPAPARIPFLRRYGAVVAVVFGVAAGAAFVFPGLADAALRSFGAPPTGVALAMLAASAVSGMACWYLYADASPAAAVAAEKLVVVGFFVAALLALGGPREGLALGDGSYLWKASLVVYVVAASVALGLVRRTPSFAARAGGAPLPAGFWPVVGYTQAEALVTYVYAALAPTLLLAWADVRSLGFLHAALRYTALLTAFPAAIMAVLAPELRRLAAEGLAAEALRQTRGTVNVAVLALAPVVLGLVVFAEPAMGFFGPEFREQADVLRWAAPSVLAAPVVLSGAGAAIAIGAFRAYLLASFVYVAAAVTLLAILVPAHGVLGAAAATSLGGLARQIAIDAVLRRHGYRPPPRLAVAWGCAVAAVAATILLRPGALASAALFAGLLTLFALLGRVGREELARLFRLGIGRG